MSAFLESVSQWDVDMQGAKAKLPVFYYDTTSMTAIFTARTAEVRRHLPHPDMHPTEVVPGSCLVAISAFEYRRSDIDPYNELSIAVLIGFRRRPLPGLAVLSQLARRSYTAWVWHLPVTTERARYGGVELYGYPKFLADIRWERSAEGLSCELVDQGRHVLTLRGRQLPTRPGKVLRFKTYSLRGGVPLCANIYTNPLEYAETRRGDAAALELGADHPIADELRSIHLGSRPLMVQLCARSEVILFAPRNLIDD